MPRLKLPIVLIVLLLVGVMVASAGSPHFIGTVSFSTGSFHMSGDLAGLGNTPVTVRLDAYAKIMPLCQKGEHTAPGYNTISVTESTSAVSSHNGRSSFNLVVPDPLYAWPLPPLPSWQTAGCSNSYWSVAGFVPHSTRWTGAKISVFLNSTGALVLEQNYTCTGVDAALTCTET